MPTAPCRIWYQSFLDPSEQRPYFERLEAEEIQASGHALIHSGTVMSSEVQIGRSHYWKGVRDVLGVPEKAANKLSRELKENDSE